MDYDQSRLVLNATRLVKGAIPRCRRVARGSSPPNPHCCCVGTLLPITLHCGLTVIDERIVADWRTGHDDRQSTVPLRERLLWASPGRLLIFFGKRRYIGVAAVECLQNSFFAKLKQWRPINLRFCGTLCARFPTLDPPAGDGTHFQAAPPFMWHRRCKRKCWWIIQIMIVQSFQSPRAAGFGRRLKDLAHFVDMAPKSRYQNETKL